MDNNTLMEYAKKARLNAYAPYSDFKVGACVLTEKGNIYTGCNIENSSYGATVCAERVAIFKAISQNDNHILKIAITGNNKKTYPCALCLQVMSEFMYDGEIIIENDDLEVYKVKDFLPMNFKLQ